MYNNNLIIVINSRTSNHSNNNNHNNHNNNNSNDNNNDNNDNNNNNNNNTDELFVPRHAGRATSPASRRPQLPYSTLSANSVK